MDERIRLAAKVFALSLLIAGLLVPTCAIGGLILYTLLDPLLPADDLASMGLFFFPFVGFGLPGVVAASRFTLLRKRHGLQVALYGNAVLLGTMGFAGFWVGAMGI